MRTPAELALEPLFNQARDCMKEDRLVLAAPEAILFFQQALMEAERIFRVLQSTGPAIPVQEAAAIEAWLGAKS